MRRYGAGLGWKRWLGEGDSWRRVVSAGIVGGIVLAMLAALVGSLFSGGSGSLDGRGPPVEAPVPVVPQDAEPLVPPVDVEQSTATDVPAEVPTATPAATVEPSPTLPAATETEVLATPEETPAS